MKVLFVETILKNILDLEEKEIKKLPKKIFIAYSVQYKKTALALSKTLKKKGIEVEGVRQILGCSKIKKKVPILLISSGKFHAENLSLQNNEVYILEGEKIKKIKKEEIEKIKKKKKAEIIKFLNGRKVGILVSLKPGQENLRKAIELKEKLKKYKKEGYIFIGENIEPSQFENFKIECWVNTACPGLSREHSLLDLEEINEVLKMIKQKNQK